MEIDHAAQDSKQVQSAKSTEWETSPRKKTECHKFTWKDVETLLSFYALQILQKKYFPA